MIDCFQIYVDNLKISVAATHYHERLKILNPLSANPTKWSNTLKQFDKLFEFV